MRHTLSSTTARSKNWRGSCRRSLRCCAREPDHGWRRQRRDSARRAAAARRRAAGRRRNRLFGAVVLGGRSYVGVVLSMPLLQKAVNEFGLPLTYADVIRQQAAEKHLDPALIAAVIYAETKFDPRTSPAGAQGLMQIMPADGRVPGAPLGRHRLHDRRPRHAAGQHRLRQLLPALPARTSTTAAHARAGRLQRRRDERRPLDRRGARRGSHPDRGRHPVPRDPGLRLPGAVGRGQVPPQVRLAAVRLTA